MTKLLYGALSVAVAAGLGCAVTDYPIITDNDQVANGQGSGIVNTNGKAHIDAGLRTLGVVWSDGVDELFSHVDQKSDGTATLTTYNNFSSDPIVLHADIYCNPDWNGCSIFTAPDNNDANIFDGTLNPNCSGARSLSTLLSTTRYYGECGRERLSLQDRIALLNMGRLGSAHGMEGLFYTATPQNLTVQVSNGAGSQILPFSGSLDLAVFTGRTGSLDLQNPLLRNSADSLLQFIESTGDDRIEFTLGYNGISRTFKTRILVDALRRIRDKRF